MVQALLQTRALSSAATALHASTKSADGVVPAKTLHDAGFWLGLTAWHMLVPPMVPLKAPRPALAAGCAGVCRRLHQG